MDTQELKLILQDLQNRIDDIRDNALKIELKNKRLAEIENQLTKEEVWSDLNLSQKLSKEKTSLEKILDSYKIVADKVSDSQVLLDVSVFYTIGRIPYQTYLPTQIFHSESQHSELQFNLQYLIYDHY